jgi:hypothetical protein
VIRDDADVGRIAFVTGPAVGDDRQRDLHSTTSTLV